MDTRRLAVGSIAVPLIAFLCIAGIRGPGKYAGVVIFDRWGGCTLYSGVYAMYVAEAVKEQLRSRAGQCAEINATQVEQEHNPGDGLIKAFTYLGAPPTAPEWAEPVAGIRLSMRPRFLDGQKPAFELRLENASEKPLTVHLDSLAPTVLNRMGGDVVRGDHTRLFLGGRPTRRGCKRYVALVGHSPREVRTPS